MPKRKRLNVGSADGSVGSSPNKRSSGSGNENDWMSLQVADVIRDNLDILVVGINPGFHTASRGHHYAGPGNHFWPCLFESGLVDEPLTCDEDVRTLEFGIGLTNMVQRATRSSSDLSKEEIRAGGVLLRKKLLNHRPKIVAFNGKGIFETFKGLKKCSYGLQNADEILSDGVACKLFVMPSSSPRCASFPRAQDKMVFYRELKSLRDQLCGNASRPQVLHDSGTIVKDTTFDGVGKSEYFSSSDAVLK